MANNETTVSNSYLSSNPDFNVADDKVGTKRYQQVKLIDSTVGSTDPVGTAANPLHVQGTSVGGDVNLAEVGGVAVTDNVPVSLKTPHDGMPLIQILGDTLVDVGCTTTVVVIAGSTAAVKAGDWVTFDSVGALALRQVAREIASVDSVTQVTLESALPATPTAGIDRLSIHRPYYVPTSSGVPKVSITESISLPVTNGAFTELADAIGAIESSSPLIGSGIQLAGDDPYAFDGPKVAAPNVINQSPAGTEFGLVTRNIPSGTQAVSGTVTVQEEADTPATGNITANGQTVSIALGRNNTVAFSISGTYGSVAIIFEISLDGGSTYFTQQAKRSDSNTIETASGTISSTSRCWSASVVGATHFRVRATAWTSGSAAIRIVGAVSATEPTPGVASHAVTGSGTFAATQSGTWSARAQDGSGNLLTSGVVQPGVGDRGLYVRQVGSYAGPTQAVNRILTFQLPQGYHYHSTRVTNTGCTTTAIACTVDPSTVCQRGDIIEIAGGTIAQGLGQWGIVASVSVTTITLESQTPLSVSPPNGLTIRISRPKFLSVDGSNRLNIYGDVSGSQVSSQPYAPNKTFFEYGEMDFSTLTNSLASVLTVANTGYIVVVANTTDKAIAYSLDGGSTKGHLGPNDNVTWNFADMGGNIDTGTEFQAMYTGAAPTLGYVSFLMGYY